MVHEVEDPPDIDILGELPHRQADDVLRVGPIAEEIDPPAQGLKHGLGHLLPQQFQLEEGIDLLAQDIHVHRGPAGDLQGKIAGPFPGRGGQQIGMQQDPVLEIGLGQIAGRIGDVIAFRLPAGFEQPR